MRIFWDITHLRVLNEDDLRRRGLDPDNVDDLATLSLYPLTVERPELKKGEACEADGYPQPVQGDPKRFVQKMRVFRPLDRFIEMAKAAASAKRWEYETKGIEFAGVKVATGVDDQNRISTSIQGMEAAGIETVNFKAASGWVELGLEQLKAIRVAIARHVEACFDNERHLHELIEACDTLDDINAVNLDDGWPSPTQFTSPAPSEDGEGEAPEAPEAAESGEEPEAPAETGENAASGGDGGAA